MWIKFQDILLQAEMGYFYKNDDHDDSAHYTIVFKTYSDNFREEFSTKKERDDRFQQIEDMLTPEKINADVEKQIIDKKLRLLLTLTEMYKC